MGDRCWPADCHKFKFGCVLVSSIISLSLTIIIFENAPPWGSPSIIQVRCSGPLLHGLHGQHPQMRTSHFFMLKFRNLKFRRKNFKLLFFLSDGETY